jgi:hypothetical protein
MSRHPSTWTEPAPKYGPTADYGGCEARECRAGARVTCIKCRAHVCFGHADQASHEVDPD